MFYSIIGMVAILINVIINRDILVRKKGSAETAAQRAYRLFNYGILAYHATDVLWGICDASGVPALLYTDTVLYFIAMYTAVMLWATYVVRYLDDRGSFGKGLTVVVYVLFILEAVMLIVNHFVHIVFWVDAAGEYRAYAFRYLALFVQIALFLVTSVYALGHQKKAQEQKMKNRYRTIGAFGIAMSAAIVIQILYPLLPFYSIGYLIGTCLIHSFIIEDENEELRRKADVANKAKTSFLFSMSHDIRTPMNAILGYTDMAYSHAENPQAVREDLDKVKIAGDHLLHLINDILEMSRIEAGKLELTEEPVDAQKALLTVKQLGESLAADKKIDFSVTTGEITDRYIYSDELHINEVLINLISNGIKYTNPGGSVSFKTEQVGAAQNGKAVYRFEVADTGIGMSEEFQEHLFQPFTREKTATVSKIQGTGIGLSIVKRIVDLAGGTISVKTALGKGSVFTVEIPFSVMPEQAVAEYKKENDPGNAPKDTAVLQGKRILLAEDNEMNREIAVFILSEAGLSVDTAENGWIAVEKFTEKGAEGYDAILMDIQMPVMDGYAATKAIRQLPEGKNIPIIALSANAFAEDKAESVAAGMNDHIAKPINSAELFNVLSGLL